MPEQSRDNTNKEKKMKKIATVLAVLLSAMVLFAGGTAEQKSEQKTIRISQFKVEIDGNAKKLSVRELFKIESEHLKHIS